MEIDPKAFRVAATVLLVRDDPFEVLMVRRHSKATFASRLVFPGGVIDADDSDPAWRELVTGSDGLDPGQVALRICGIRETWEETSVLLATDVTGHSVAAPEGMTDAPFREVVAASGGRMALDALHPFGHWITPEVEPRRFDTHFFVAKAPDDQTAVADGGETVELEWLSPKDAVARNVDGAIMFPTELNLRRLGESDSAQAALDAADARPIVTVQPRGEARENGDLWVVIPAEAGYGITEHLHRRAIG
jgi:8-oxo-dGTP pyrophosphatase MutT (NUDIX family)